MLYIERQLRSVHMSLFFCFFPLQEIVMLAIFGFHRLATVALLVEKSYNIFKLINVIL